MKTEIYRNLIDQIAAAVLILDDKGVIQYVNQDSLSLLGSEKEEQLIGINFDQFVSADQRPDFQSYFQSIMQGKKPHESIYSLVDQDNTIKNVVLSGAAIHDQAEFITKTIWTLKEISPRLQLVGEEDLHQDKLKDLYWLSEQGRYLLSINRSLDILDFAGKMLQEKIQDCLVLTLANTDENNLRLQNVFGLENKILKRLWALIGEDLKGKIFPIEDRFAEAYRKRELIKHPGGLENFAINHVPPKVSRQIKKLVGVEDVYTIGLEGNSQVKGCLYIFTLSPNVALNKNLVESFTFQVALALENSEFAGELEFSEEQFRVIFDNAPDGYFICDLKGNIVDGNRAVKRITGFSADDVQGKSILEIGIIPKPQLPWAKKLVAKIIKGKSTDPIEMILTRTDGIPVQVEISSHHVIMGGKIRILGFIRDVTPRKIIEEELEKSHSSVTRVVDGIDAHVYVADMENYKILYMNQKMIDDYGGNFTGGNCHEVFHGEENVCTDCSNANLINNLGEPGEVCVSERQNVINKKWYRNYDRAIYWPDQRIVRMQIAIDITDNKQNLNLIEQSETRYRNLFESSHDAVMTLAPPDWNFTSGNSAMMDMFRIDEESEFLAYQPWELSPEYQPGGQRSDSKAPGMIMKAVNSGSCFFTWTHMRSDGEEFPATVQLTRVDHEQEYFLQATVRDITEQLQAEKVLKQQMDDLSLINSLNVAVNKSRDLTEIFTLLSRSTNELFDGKSTAVYLFSDDLKNLIIDTKSMDSDYISLFEEKLGIEIPGNLEIPMNKIEIMQDILDRQMPRLLTDQQEIQRYMDDLLDSSPYSKIVKNTAKSLISQLTRKSHIKSLMILPMITAGNVIGFVDLFSKRDLTNIDLDRFQTLIEQLSGIIQRIRAENDRADNIQELKFINRTIAGGTRIEETDGICSYLAERVQETNPNAYVMVSLYDPDQEAIRVRALTGQGKFADKLLKILGRKPEEIIINVSNNRLDDHLTSLYTSGKLELIPGGLFDLTRGFVSKRICSSIERMAGVSDIYIAGFGLEGQSIGGLVLFMKEGDEVQFPEAIEAVVSHYSVLFERRRVQHEVLERKLQLELLREVELDIVSQLDLESLLQSLSNKAASIVEAVASGFYVYNSERDVLEYLVYTGFDELPENTDMLYGEGLSGKVWQTKETVIVENYAEWEGRSKSWVDCSDYYLAGIPVCWGDELLGVLEIALKPSDHLSTVELGMLELFATQAAIAIKNARLFNEEKMRRTESETLREVGLMINQVIDRPDLLDMILASLQKVVPFTSASIQLVRGSRIVVEAFQGDDSENDVIGRSYDINKNQVASQIIYEGKNIVLQGKKEIEQILEGPGIGNIQSWLAVPLESKGNRIGILTLDHDLENQFSERDVNMVSGFAAQAVVALENSRLFEEAHQRLFKIESQRQIDLAISGTVDLEISMSVLVRQLVNALDVDSATVLIRDKNLGTLDYIASHGFVTDSLKFTSLKIGQGLAGKAALDRKIVKVFDLTSQETSLQNSPALIQEMFISYIAVPLIAKGEVVGVLEVFHRDKLDPDQEWYSFLEALAGQAAIAIDRMNLFDELEDSNLELTRAYDATIEGWAKAIELRDSETEGHSRRVVKLTIQLAMRMGLSGDSLLNIRRGALLHDIGKMAIPDRILMKPGELSDDEWSIMKEHPVHAFEMLSSIGYLQSALDIPYCHHERWDGTGYPRGLKGEGIPLPARIFAVVDVWDALQSDRPYRPAWSEKDAIKYIKEENGTHFDPLVVEEFLAFMTGD